MKKLLSLILSVFMFLTIGTTNIFAEERNGTLPEGSNISWKYNTQTKILTLSGTGAIPDYTTDANYGCVSNINVDYASVEKIIIEEGITKIGNNAFRWLGALKEVYMPSTLKAIGQGAFENCSNLKNLGLPDGLETISSGAFQGCKSLGKVVIPSGITSVHRWAFSNAIAVLFYKGSQDLSSVYSLGLVTGDEDFDENGFLIVDDKLILYTGPRSEQNSAEDIVIPDGVKTIGSYAFSYTGRTGSKARYIKDLTIPASVTTIENDAFNYYYPTYESRFTGSIIYGSSKSDWEKIDIGSGNSILTKRNIKYAATQLSSDTSVVEGENIVVTITPADEFNASYIKLNFDSSKVSFVSATDGFGTKVENGSLILSCYGLEGISQIVANFIANTPGIAEFSIAEAKFGTKTDAEDKDLVASNVDGSSCSTTIRSALHSVTFSSNDLFNGLNQVIDGSIYEFTATDDTHYTYSNVTATMNSESVAVNYDSTSKKYSVANVTGDLVINGTRTGNEYNITYSTTTNATLPTSPSKARYGETVTFQIPTEENWAYNVTSVSGQIGEYSVVNGTLAFTMGANVTVTINKETRDQSVTVEGNGISDVTAATSYTKGTDFTFTVTKDTAYTYTVSAKVNNASVELTHNEECDVYTITAPVYGGIVITVNKSVVNGTITATEFVKFNGKIVYLIKNEIQKLDGNRYFTYDGKDMFWSNTYNSYCYLVVSAIAPSIDGSLFDLKTGTVKVVSNDGDVNETGNVDSNDAQLVWNMYKPLYSDFTEKVTMEKFLKADVNGDGKITVADAAKILNIAYGINSSSSN